MLSTNTSITRCVIYTRKSTEEGLDQAFNSLDAQREACEAYIKSQAHEGWILVDKEYSDGGFSGGNLKRPALECLMKDIQSDMIDLIIVYKVDRLTRSLHDFSKMVETFDNNNVSFVSITQQFNTSTSMGSLTLNVLLSFAQFEREVTGERIRDKVAASKKKGMWMGGYVPLGYNNIDKKLSVNDEEANTVRYIFGQYLALGSVKLLKEALDNGSVKTKVSQKGNGGGNFSRGALYALLKNQTYLGKVKHKKELFPGNHQAIINDDLWRKVQDLLTSNKQASYVRTNVKEPALLAGLLFDENGNPLSPTHTRKKNRRYKYYINQSLLQFKQISDSSITRIPADDLEQVVEDNLISLLSPLSLASSVAKPLKLSAFNQELLITNSKVLSSSFSSLSADNKIDLYNKIIIKLIISRASLEITYSIANIANQMLEDNSYITNKTFNMSVPLELKRCGVETKLIIQDGSQQKTVPHSDSLRAIQNAVRRGLEWNQQLITGQELTAKEIAARVGMSDRYVCLCIKLAFLSPDNIKKIIIGDIPYDMTLQKLLKGFPLDWKKQSSLFTH